MARCATVAMYLMLAACSTTDSSKPFTLASLTDTCAGYPELTGQNVLSLLQPTYAATYTPLGGSSSSSFSLAVSYDGGPITCYPYENGECCFAQVALEVSAHLMTGDGTFNDSFPGSAWLSKAAAEEGLDEFNANVPVANLHGTFRPAPGTWSKDFVIFGGGLLPHAATAGSANTVGQIHEQVQDADCAEIWEIGSWQ